MSSASPFKKKSPRQPTFIQNIENLQPFPRTFKQLQEQKTYRTILDSDITYTLGQSRKTIVSQMRQSRKESLGINDDLLRLKQAQITKLQQSLFLEKGINQCLREEIYKNKQKIYELAQELDQNHKEEEEKERFKGNNKIIGILKNKKQKEKASNENENQIQTLRFGAPKHKKSKVPLEQQNKRLKQYISSLQDNFMKCKYLLEDMEEKSKGIEQGYELQIKALKMNNQYLRYQIKQFN